jgi:hypothetical protein
MAAASARAGAFDDPEGRLGALHADWPRFIHAIRVVSFDRARVSPTGIYSGLVRPGGGDPRIRSDAPLSGSRARNDLILYPSAFEGRRGAGWLTLILDHEYFHARHLARSAPPPLVDFGDRAGNTHYYEATAWSYVLSQARGGVYGELTAGDLREVTATYRRHYDAFREYVEERQPSAWMHYGRYLVSPD